MRTLDIYDSHIIAHCIVYKGVLVGSQSVVREQVSRSGVLFAADYAYILVFVYGKVGNVGIKLCEKLIESDIKDWGKILWENKDDIEPF